MVNVSNIDSKWCETKTEQFQRCHSNLHSYYGLQKFKHWKIMNKLPDVLVSAAELFHRIQRRLVHFQLFCSYVYCIIDWSVFLVNVSIHIRLKNSYKKKKNYSLKRPYRILGLASLLFNGIGQPFSDS